MALISGVCGGGGGSNRSFEVGDFGFSHNEGMGFHPFILKGGGGGKLFGCYLKPV